MNFKRKIQKITNSILLLSLTVFSFFSTLPQKVSALNQFDSPAETVIGQTGFGECNIAPNQGDLERGFSSPYGGIKAGDKLIVSDFSNHRVLVYNSVPNSANQKPDVVIGQPNLCSVSSNQGMSTPQANTLYGPKSLFFDGNKLFIVDRSNNRILIYNSIPTSNNASADVVIGQIDMDHGLANQGTSVNANTLNLPISIMTKNGKLFIADSGNNRVLIFNSIPTSNNASADVVIGQPDMISNTANNGGRNSNTLYQPTSIDSDGTKLFISELNNNRVLIFNSIPEINNVSANIVIGQSNMTSGTVNAGGLNNNTLYYPTGVKFYNNKLYIADYYNNRILIFNSVPAVNKAPADLVLGQADFTHNSANQGGSVSDNTLYRPTSVQFWDEKMIVGDQDNNRLLIFNTAPTSNNASADVVLGQKDFSSNGLNQSGEVTARNLFYPRGAFHSSGKLFIADQYNGRVLIYNSIPTENNAAADVVVGQSNMISGSQNQGGSINSNTLSNPTSIFATNNKLFIADYTNNRVLIYNSIPTSNNASADTVIGQADFTHGSINQGSSVNSNTLYYPKGVWSDGEKLFIADSGNNRILIYNSIPTSNNASANVVIGQADFTHNSANQGGTTGANTLSSPSFAQTYNGKLFVSDSSNNRVLVFNQIPTGNNTQADKVIGQPNLTSGSANQGNSLPDFNTLSYPVSTFTNSNNLFIAEQPNNRVSIFSPIPEQNDSSANAILGQESENGYLPGSSTKNLNRPSGFSATSDKLIVIDTNNHRILIYPLGPQGASFSAPSSSDSRNVNLSLTSTDAKEMMISENADFSGASWETFSVGKQFLLSKVGGAKRIYVKMRDWANYEGEVLSRDITLDNVKPVITNNQSQVVSAGTREVELSISTSKNSTCKFGVTDVGYDNLSNVFSTTGGLVHTSTISVSDGTDYRYYVKCEDGVGNIESSEINFSVSKTEYIPTISLGNKVINLSSNETAVLKNKTIGFKGTLSNSHLKLGKVELRKNGKFVKKVLINKRNQWRLSTRENLKERNITQEYQFVYYDSHNNIVETSNVYKILVDRKKPKIVSPGHQTLRVIPNQTITVNATDEGGIEYYQFTLRGVSYPKQTNNAFTLPPTLPKGKSNLVIRVYDKAGNVGKGVVRMRY